MRASAPLTSGNGVANGTCGTYSAYAQIGANDPAAAVSDTVPTDNTCYRYRYLVSDHVGNIATYASAEIKVQTTAAASLATDRRGADPGQRHSPHSRSPARPSSTTRPSSAASTSNPPPAAPYAGSPR